MKILLVLSLIINVVLGVLYSQAPTERIVIEQEPAKIIEKEVLVEVPTEVKPKKKKSSNVPDELHGEMASEDYLDQVEQVETYKKDYLINQLGLTEEILKKEGKLRGEFIRASTKIYVDSHMGQPSIPDRRKLLDLEEDLQNKVVKLYGKNNWEKFQKFQNKYNQESIKRMEEGNSGPTLIMGP